MQERITQISDRIEDLAEPLAARRERIQTAKARRPQTYGIPRY